MLFTAVLVSYNLILTAALVFSAVQDVSSPSNLILLGLLAPPALYFLLPRRSFLAAVKTLAFILSLATTTILFSFNLLSPAASSSQLFALALAPLPFYFWGTLIARVLNKDKKVAGAKQESLEEEELEPVKDFSRRDFLKKAGGVGLGLLAWSLLNPRQAGAAFFGSVPGPGVVGVKNIAGSQIDPAEKYPTSGYGISEIDDAGTTLYYGFVEKDGAWYILKESDAAGDLSYLYATPANNPTETDFTDAWADHATTLTYQQFDSAF